MRFAQSLRGVEGVYSQYVCYKTLKKFINLIEKEDAEGSNKGEVHASELWVYDSTEKTTLGTISDNEAAFVSNLEQEIIRVKRLYSSKSSQLYDQLTDVFRRLYGGFSLDHVAKDLDSIAHDLIGLDRFVRQAKTMFYKILKKHDRRTTLRAAPVMMARLELEQFWNPKLDELVVGLSDAYYYLRTLENSEVENEKADLDYDLDKFERKTEKYFVRAEDIMHIKMTILKHLPVDIFGRNQNDLFKNKPSTRFSDYLNSVRGLSDSSVINSIYLDNDPLAMYHERMGFETPRGNLIRVRWYGDHVNPPDYVFMERKTRISFGVKKIDDAIKERFRIKNANVDPYLVGKWTTVKKLEKMVDEGKIKKDKAEDLLQTSCDIQNEIVTKSLGPAVRTVCRRTAFQQGKDQSLRFSLDTNLHMIDETPAIKQNRWYRNMDKRIAMGEVIKFPFAVLEIKVQKDPPQWVLDLKNSPYVIKAEHFSKFLYGSARLRGPKIRFYPTWYETTLQLIANPPERALSLEPCGSSDLPALPPRSPHLTSGEKKQKKKEPTPLILVPKREPSPRFTVPTPEIKRIGARGSMDKFPEFDIEDPKKTPARSGMFSSIFSRRKSVSDESTKPATLKKGASGNQQRIAKSFFSNERTLLSWVNTVTFLSLTGLTLLNTGTQVGNISGLIMIILTIAFAIYALSRFRSRLDQLSNQTLIGIEDRLGPAILVSCMCGVLLFVGVYFVVTG